MVHCKINNHLTARTEYIIQFIHNTSSLRRLRNMSAWEKTIRQQLITFFIDLSGCLYENRDGAIKRIKDSSNFSRN